MFKPFDRHPVSEPIGRDLLRQNQVSHADLSRCLQFLMEEMGRKPDYLDRLVIKAPGRVLFVNVRDIDWFEAAGNYVRLHNGKSKHLFRQTMNKLEAKLDPSCFLRIHRETIVNLDRVVELQPLFHGNFAVLLKTGAELTLSRSYRAQLQKQLRVYF